MNEIQLESREVGAGERHFWFPIPSTAGGGVRHAFAGRRWEGEAAGTSACGSEVAFAQPTEVDWICFPTCADCYSFLTGRTT